MFNLCCLMLVPMKFLQQVHDDRGHLLDKRSKRIMRLLRGGVGHGDENREGRVGSRRQRCRWCVAMNTTLIWF
jgi:hypothetical protein